jgi:hypothetical protein
VRLLCGELADRLDTAAGRLAGGRQLAPGPFGERRSPHCGQHAVRGLQLSAGVHPPVLAAQPFAVQQVGAGELGAELGTAEPVDRLAVPALGGLAVA